MQKIQRIAAVGAIAALTVALGACGSSAAPSTDTPASSAPASASEAPAAAGDGVTTVDDIIGACEGVPTDAADEGSAQGMVDDPVGTAATNNPVLDTLEVAVTMAGLVETLNDPAATYTVLAPSNDAFAAIPEDTLNAVLADVPTLTSILTYHVSSTRSDAAALVEAGEFVSLDDRTVMVGGSADAPTFQGAGNDAPATTLCGNVPTANATVFVIDTVLMPAAS